MNDITQEQAAQGAGLLLHWAYIHLTMRDNEMFFFLFGTAMGMFNKYNIEIIYHEN